MTKTFTTPIPDDAGRMHTFVYEVDEFLPLSDWILSTKTKEENDFWLANDSVGKHTDIGAEYYAEWLVSQKLIHTVTRADGTEIVNDYHTYL
jgi:hypothetical protein